MATMQTTQLHLRISLEETEVLDGLCGSFLKRQQIALMVLSAAIAAIKANGGKASLPISFTVGQQQDTNSKGKK